jgi:hypothetical protein
VDLEVDLTWTVRVKDNNCSNFSKIEVAPVSSSDKGNGHDKPAEKEQPYLGDLEITLVQRNVLDVWEENFGRISRKVRLAAAKVITEKVRESYENWNAEDLIAAVESYAARGPKHPMSPSKFFRSMARRAEEAVT